MSGPDWIAVRSAVVVVRCGGGVVGGGWWRGGGHPAYGLGAQKSPGITSSDCSAKACSLAAR